MKEQDLFTLEAGNAVDAVLSADQSKLYVDLSTGAIDVFDVATRQKVATWQVGVPLGALSVAQDGSYLLAEAPQQPIIYRVDTSTGALTNTFIGTGYSFVDVQTLDGHVAAATGTNPSLLNVDTGEFTPLKNAVSYSGYSIMNSDGNLTLLGETAISDGPLFVLDNKTGTVIASGTDYQPGATPAANFGSQAISQAAGMILQFVPSGQMNVYDLSVKYQRSVNIGEPIAGLTFDANGSHVFAYLMSGAVVEYDATTFKELHRFQAEPTSINSSVFNYGNAISLTGDGHYAVVTDYPSETDDHDGVVQLIDISAAGNPVIGTAGNDHLVGSSGADVITPGAGRDVVDGEGGFDTLVLSGAQTAYQVSDHGGHITLYDKAGDSVDVSNIEQVRFTDGTVAWSDVLRENAPSEAPSAEVYRLYETILGRAPDAGGLAGYSDALHADQSLDAVATDMFLSDEASAFYKGLSNKAFVTKVYETAFGREPDPDGLATYTNALNNKTISRVDVILAASESDEKKALTAEAVSTGLFTQDVTQVHNAVELLYDAIVNRAADPGGLSAYEREYATGSSLLTIASQMASSGEAMQLYGGLDNKGFVDELYKVALNRLADPAGEAALIHELDTGTSRATLLWEAAGSNEHQALLGLHSDLFM